MHLDLLIRPMILWTQGQEVRILHLMEHQFRFRLSPVHPHEQLHAQGIRSPQVDAIDAVTQATPRATSIVNNVGVVYQAPPSMTTTNTATRTGE